MLKSCLDWRGEDSSVYGGSSADHWGVEGYPVVQSRRPGWYKLIIKNFGAASQSTPESVNPRNHPPPPGFVDILGKSRFFSTSIHIYTIWSETHDLKKEKTIRMV